MGVEEMNKKRFFFSFSFLVFDFIFIHLILFVFLLNRTTQTNSTASTHQRNRVYSVNTSFVETHFNFIIHPY